MNHVSRLMVHGAWCVDVVDAIGLKVCDRVCLVIAVDSWVLLSMDD